MPASPASRAASWHSRPTNSSGWRCSHIRRTSPRSSSTSQSSRIGRTVVYQPAVLADHLFPVVQHGDRHGGAEQRVVQPPPDPLGRAEEASLRLGAGSAISRSRVRRTMSSSASPWLGSATGTAIPAAGAAGWSGVAGGSGGAAGWSGGGPGAGRGRSRGRPALRPGRGASGRTGTAPGSRDRPAPPGTHRTGSAGTPARAASARSRRRTAASR